MRKILSHAVSVLETLPVLLAIPSFLLWFFWWSQADSLHDGALILAHMPIALFCSFAIHEFGHVLGGWAVRCPCIVVGFFFFELTREYGRWAIGWDRSGRTGALLVPSTLEDIEKRAAVWIAAGPAASCLFATLCF